jgi:hypothetical protein
MQPWAGVEIVGEGLCQQATDDTTADTKAPRILRAQQRNTFAGAERYMQAAAARDDGVQIKETDEQLQHTGQGLARATKQHRNQTTGTMCLGSTARATESHGGHDCNTV